MSWSSPRISGMLVVLSLVGGSLLSGCSHQPSGPDGAVVQLKLSSAYSDDGGLFLTVAGGRVDSVDAPGLTVYSHRPDPSTLEIILTGSLVSGTVARLWLPDERQIPRYSARVNQAAARGSYIQRDPTTYRLTVEP